MLQNVLTWDALSQEGSLDSCSASFCFLGTEAQWCQAVCYFKQEKKVIIFKTNVNYLDIRNPSSTLKAKQNMYLPHILPLVPWFLAFGIENKFYETNNHTITYNRQLTVFNKEVYDIVQQLTNFQHSPTPDSSVLNSPWWDNVKWLRGDYISLSRYQWKQWVLGDLLCCLLLTVLSFHKLFSRHEHRGRCAKSWCLQIHLELNSNTKLVDVIR